MTSAAQPRPLRVGALAATLTFFEKDTENLDLTTIRKHAVRLVRAGITGLVVLGSNGEAPHLNQQERVAVISETRSALEEAGFTDIPLLTGASSSSVRGTVELCKEAAAAGGDYALILPPSYFKGGMSPQVISNFYTKVADLSPIPILIYSFPAVTAGIEMDSDLIIAISQHENIVGTKFTCGDTGKLARVARSLNAATPTAKNSGYMCYGGLADFALMALVAGASGFIAGGANVVPKACVAVVKLFIEQKFLEAIELQRILSDGDWHHTKAGVAGTKNVLQGLFNYGGLPRLPLQPQESDQAKDMLAKMDDVIVLEGSL